MASKKPWMVSIKTLECQLKAAQSRINELENQLGKAKADAEHWEKLVDENNESNDKELCTERDKRLAVENLADDRGHAVDEMLAGLIRLGEKKAKEDDY
jgi:hypothetical protein